LHRKMYGKNINRGSRVDVKRIFPYFDNCMYVAHCIPLGLSFCCHLVVLLARTHSLTHALLTAPFCFTNYID
jgi:hypothetical protein